MREVVTQITINPNTVHRAYRELEYQGLAEGRTGLGTFITPRAGDIAGESELASVIEALKEWTALARAVGIDEDEMIDLLRRLLNLDERAWS